MVVTFELTVDDFLEERRIFMTTSGFYRMLFLFVKLLVPGIAILYFVSLSLVKSTAHLWIYGIIFLTISLLWVLLSTRLVRSLVLVLLKYLLKSRASDMFGSREVEINEHEICVRRPHAESIFQWESIQRVTETDEYYFLYVHALAALIIPKRFDNATLTELSDKIKDYRSASGSSL
ncbi:MAG: YcxB family protein [Leptolyngbya sp. SIO3F4]|nr:YcxB family protein [Leptolyngbya sp. SIO3F4]